MSGEGDQTGGTCLPHPHLSSVPAFMEAIELTRRTLDRERWRSFCETDGRLSAWRDILKADPYTRHGLTKPRGYPDDAGLMDLAYGHPSAAETLGAACEDGRYIYTLTSAAPQSVSARLRIEYVAKQINEVLSGAGGSRRRLASFASGHARELEHVHDCSTVDCIYLIDSDRVSLKEAEASYATRFPIKPLNASVFKFSAAQIPSVDFAYSMGLFDYLGHESAVRVVGAMAATVSPGGVLLVGNLSVDAANLGYCEAVMDWWMATRAVDDMKALGDALVERSDWAFEVTTVGCFHYLIARRPSAPA